MAAGAGQARQQIVHFGEFELDTSSQTLLHSGVRVKLQKQPFQLLELLIQRAPEIVSREEIRRHIWGDEVYIDAKQSINFCVRQVRLALGDALTRPRFIETFPRQGYRFIAPLRGVPEDTGNPGHPLVEPPKPRLAPVQWLIWGLVALVVLATLAGVSSWLRKEMTTLRVAHIKPVTTYPGDEREPSLAPDGRQVAFSWEGEQGGARHIYIGLLGEQHPLRLTSGAMDDSHPAWSPDGKHIAFIRHSAGTRADIMIVPALGGAARKLREIRLSAWVSNRTLAWSPDAKWLCFTDEIGKSGHEVLFLLSLESDAVHPILSEEENGIGDSSPAFSPDGKWLAFARFEHPYNSSLLIQRLSPNLTSDGKAIIVQNAGLNPKAPVWTPDGKKIIFLDGSRIMEAEFGRPALPLYVSTSNFSELTLAGPNLRLVACLQSGHEEIWATSLTAKGLKADGAARRILPSSAGEDHPRFSPDGRSLAFSSGRSGASEIWLADSDGRNPRQLTNSSFYIAGYVRWSPDGQSVAFHARLPKQPQLYVVRVADGLVKQVTHGMPGFMGPSWSLTSPILYADALENGTNRTYSIPFPAGIPKFLFDGADAAEAPGRQLLIYYKPDQWGIYARSLVGDVSKNPERLLVKDYQAPWGGFYAVNEGIYYAGSSSIGVPRAFRFYSFDTDKAVDVTSSPPNLSHDLTVTPDRTRLAYSIKSQGSEDLIEIELQR